MMACRWSKASWRPQIFFAPDFRYIVEKSKFSTKNATSDSVEQR